MVNKINTRCDLMLFGALGDLAQRKLFPALYQLERANLLAEGSRVLAIARSDADTETVRQQLFDKLKQYVKPEEFDAGLAES
ncbi:MAG TPA: glucose-6-phosphate dehydrogenase, partial [Marinobacter adhaerens]|nr:glucose-6-phosphate dehydrogenase [Marinobacter adhaerens]